MQPDETVWSALLRRREEILTHPRHDEARALQDRLYFEVIRPERFPGKLKVDVRRMMLLGLVMTGDATAEEADPSTWPTLVRLKATMRQFDMDGARRIDELVARLAQTGYIRLDPHPADRRVRWVRPQEPLRVWFLEWLTVYFEAHHLLFPDPIWMRTTRRHPGFLAAFLRSASRNLALPAWVLQENARFAAFVRSDQAHVILKALTRLQRSAADGGVREIELLEAVGPYGVSRSHLRDSLALALDSAYVERSGPRDQHWIMSAEGLAADEMNMRNAIRCLSVEEEAGEAGA